MAFPLALRDARPAASVRVDMGAKQFEKHYEKLTENITAAQTTARAKTSTQNQQFILIILFLVLLPLGHPHLSNQKSHLRICYCH